MSEIGPLPSWRRHIFLTFSALPTSYVSHGVTFASWKQFLASREVSLSRNGRQRSSKWSLISLYKISIHPKEREWDSSTSHF